MNYMVFNKSQWHQVYKKTPRYKKLTIIANWKQRGINHNNGLQYLYDVIYLPATNCSKCNIVFGTGSNKKHCDHDHNIIGTHNFRAVLCMACNINDNSRNTSGTPNINYHKTEKKWRYSKVYNKLYHEKHFKCYYQAVIYKWLYEAGYSVEVS